MEQLERIRHMEQILDDGSAAVQNLQEALERYRQMQGRLTELFDYYFSPLWQQDLADDTAGKLPEDLKRGVLSEDAVYDLFTECRRLEAMDNPPEP